MPRRRVADDPANRDLGAPPMPPVDEDRSTRRSRDELGKLLIEAGTQLLIEDGLGTGAEHVTFKRVFERLEASSGIRVTNASVIGRIWDSQGDFQIDLLSTIAGDDVAVGLDHTFDAVGTVLEEADRSSVEGRRRAVREVCRVGGGANLNALAGSRKWKTWVGVWALVMTGPKSRENRSIERALRMGYERVTDVYHEAYAALVSQLGVRLRDPLTLRQFVVAAAALGEGCALRDTVDSESVRRIDRPTGPGGSLQEWTLFGIGLEALVTEFFVVDPTWSVD